MLDAAVRIARAEDAVLVPAYLLVVPLEFGPSPRFTTRSSVAMPLLEAVELAAGRAGVPVDARIERGSSPIDALQRLWASRRSTASSSRPRLLTSGFSPKELAWMLTHAPAETLILRPRPDEPETASPSSPPARA